MNIKIVAINKLFIKLLLVLKILLVLISDKLVTVESCSVDMCSREYSSVLQVSQSHPIAKTEQYCGLLNAYQHCLRSIGRSCRGNLEFHTLQTLLKNWKHEYNCSQSSTQQLINKQTVATPQRRSGQSLINSHNSQSHQQNQHKILQQQERLQLCLSSAYNFTINSNNITVMKESRIKDERIQLFNNDKDSHLFDHQMRTSSGRRRDQMKLRHRSGRNSDNSEIPVKTNYFPIRGETIDFDDNNDNNDKSESNTDPMSPTTVPTVKPSVPPSPPLTCIIYGDPHLRTFNNEYQTCRCLGAWPLIDHPLFAVQITNSRIKGSNPQITGVTKVTVLVRQFGRCGIHNDLLYEADSTPNQGGQWSGSPSATFIDGSTSTTNNLIRITTSSNNNVITIHLDHIGVRVYIGQFENSNYLNVVIKFRSATSTVKQQLVLNSISSNSLCKTGCPNRELIDIKNILKATGVAIDIDSKNIDKSNYKDVNDYKSDETVINSNDDSVVDEEESLEDPCSDLYGYYRISCLYDVTIKGVKDVNNAHSCRFAQSFDEMKFVQNSILNNVNNHNENNVQIIAKSSSTLTFNHSYYILLVIVISLFFSSKYYTF